MNLDGKRQGCLFRWYIWRVERALSFSFVKELTGRRKKGSAEESPDRYSHLAQLWPTFKILCLLYGNVMKAGFQHDHQSRAATESKDMGRIFREAPPDHRVLCNDTSSMHSLLFSELKEKFTHKMLV